MAQGVDHGCFHAVVGSKPADKKFIYSLFAQVAFKVQVALATPYFSGGFFRESFYIGFARAVVGALGIGREEAAGQLAAGPVVLDALAAFTAF